jgi:hypothetical protein
MPLDFVFLGSTFRLMPKKSDAIVFHKPDLVHLVSFSGAHSVGKSTLISALSKEIPENELKIVPSCSSEWFRRKQKTNPECKTYDDVNRLGLREEMQASLPAILSDLLHERFKFCFNECPGKNVILCDRWFSDISAYTISELGPQKFIDLEERFNKFFHIMQNLADISRYYGSEFFFTEIFIPVSSCSHALLRGEGPDGKPRATLDQIEWEKNYNAVRDRYTFEGHSLTIQSSSVSDRVAEVMRRIG